MIHVRWFRRRNVLRVLRKKGNFGDDLNPVIVKGVSGQDVKWVAKTGRAKSHPVYLVIGSILHWADEDTVVWGTGFMSADAVPRGRPLSVCAVRGPLTRRRLLDLQIECPPVYGDPALLYPLLYYPRVEKRYRLGIIPHYSELRKNVVKRLIKVCGEGNGTKLIDPGREITTVVNDIVSCERVVSSSLHGLILSHAYGIPAAHISFSKAEVFADYFKYHDYHGAVGVEYDGPLEVRMNGDNADIEALIRGCRMRSEARIDLEALLKACPFLDRGIGDRLRRKAADLNLLR